MDISRFFSGRSTFTNRGRVRILVHGNARKAWLSLPHPLRVQIKLDIMCLKEHTHDPVEGVQGSELNLQWIEVHMHYLSQTNWALQSYGVASNVHHIDWLKT